MDVFDLRRIKRIASRVEGVTFFDLLDAFGSELWEFMEWAEEIKKKENTKGVPELPTLNLNYLHKIAIKKALEDSHFVQSDAAKLLGISPRTVNYYVDKYKIKHPGWSKNK